MNRPLILKIVLLILVLSSIQACKPRREIVPVVDDVLRSPERALRTLHASQADFEYYSTRFSGNALWEGKEYPVAGSLKIEKDKVIFLSIAPFLGIEVARLLITPDSVKFINRMQSTYFVGDMEFINSMLGTELDFYMLQSLLTGNDFDHFTTENFRVSDDRSMILLRSVGRRPKNNRQADQMEHSIWMDPANFRIRKAIMVDTSGGRRIEADYHNYENLKGQWLPDDLDLSFTEPNSRAELSVRLNRATLNQPQEFSFSIPSRYKPMDL